MACYYPIPAWRGERLDSGKRRIVFDKSKEQQPGSEMQIPCGQCIGCRLERSRQWAMRCVHEASLYQDNCFITLTYDDEHLPKDLSLSVPDYQKFMKRLRKAYPDDKIRFYQCGEYGENYGRPHYHACLFNFDFSDKELWSIRGETRLYTSKSLNQIWGKGYCVIGEVTFESAAYVARYIMKKITGKDSEEYYQGRKPEYTTMSRRPGIGRGWYEEFKDDVFPHDYTVVREVKVRPPLYYSRQFELESPLEFEEIKARRKFKIKHEHSRLQILLGYTDRIVDGSPERLAVKEAVKRAKLKDLSRNLEKEI